MNITRLCAYRFTRLMFCPDSMFQRFSVLVRIVLCIELYCIVCAQLVVYAVWVWFCACGCLYDMAESIAGRIYIKYASGSVLEIYRQNQLCKDIFNVMHNKASERNETNEQITCTHSLTLAHSIQLVVVPLLLLLLVAFAKHEQHKHDGKKFNCTGVAAISICTHNLSLARIFFIWPCILCVAKIWIWEIRKMHIVCNK